MENNFLASGLQAFIKQNRLKQKDIADYLGVSPPFITQIIQGTRCLPEDKVALLLSNNKWDTSMLIPSQSVGDISNSNVSGVNVSGNDIHINPNAYDTLLEIVRSNQKTTEKFQEQMDRLISVIECRYGTENR